MSVHIDYAAAYPHGLGLAVRLRSAARYAGVLALWAALFIIRPGLALQIFRERRADSPLRRRWT